MLRTECTFLVLVLSLTALESFSIDKYPTRVSLFQNRISSRDRLPATIRYSRSCHDMENLACLTRRQTVLKSSSAFLFPFLFQKAAHSVMMEQPKEKVFQVGQALGVDEAKARFQEAHRTLDYLIKNYDSISSEGGDNVRRYLGTVGTTSKMYGISKVMKGLQEEAADIVEYTENMQDFDYYLGAADTAVYSANFVEFSAAKTKPEKFFADAKTDCLKMKTYMDNMAVELGLPN